MDRRDFLSTSLAASSFALANYQPTLAALADLPSKRVGGHRNRMVWQV